MTQIKAEASIAISDWRWSIVVWSSHCPLGVDAECFCGGKDGNPHICPHFKGMDTVNWTAMVKCAIAEEVKDG